MSFAQMYIVYFHICLISAHWQSYFSALAVSYKYKESQPVVMMQRMQRENTMVRQIRVIIVDQDDDFFSEMSEKKSQQTGNEFGFFRNLFF